MFFSWLNVDERVGNTGEEGTWLLSVLLMMLNQVRYRYDSSSHSRLPWLTNGWMRCDCERVRTYGREQGCGGGEGGWKKGFFFRVTSENGGFTDAVPYP